MSKSALLCCLLSCLSVPSAAQQSGVLLGLTGVQCSDNKCANRSHTLWIAPAEGKLKVLADLDDLIVPRTSGFWRVAIRSRCHATDWSISQEDALTVQPVTAKAPDRHDNCKEAEKEATRNYEKLIASAKSSEGDDDDPQIATAKMHGPAELCESTGIDILFINPDYISTSESYNEECGVHPDGSRSYQVAKLDAPSQPVAFSSLAGENAKQIYDRAALQALVENANDFLKHEDPGHQPYTVNQTIKELSADNSQCFPELTDTGWLIARKKGSWVAQGGVSTGRLCSAVVKFPLVAGSLTGLGIHENPGSLDAVKKTMPAARDAFWSPRGDMVVVRTGDILQVFAVEQQRLVSPPLMIPVTAEDVVMAEWALGQSVARWTRALNEYSVAGKR